MSENYGPYVQMGTLAERMAAHYQTDANLELGPHLSHYMEEVEVNIAAHSFDHVGFMNKIHDRLEKSVMAASSLRHNEFLHAVIAALQDRINQH
ncbi:hypothetical protein DSM25558_2754 [Agrobacterium sp. DSM 25558]|uniref:hypothetical protein n=1 Tax=Agrobacterium sp. DSM 25558 TaxID=1907665 RepID=UPI0009725625|nr:hypothetical protein [Agrobacterium sp. DSM 25558]SCX20501.1 hypothetical protein DSM25558_2754 [Agrobacterium sp. DSM 25558]